MIKLSLFIFFTMTSFISEAEQINKKIKKVDAKCHVELYGGVETIYFRTIKSNQLDKLLKKLINKNVLTPSSSEKQKIYKVHECVFLQDTFKTSSSKKVDARTAR
jgi:hypothetical protein